jgi:predicted glycoside hydrolase/deacetylase ChbG (UPF0249 family)
MTRRFLVVTADDFGIGPKTSDGILDLAERGVVTSTVLLVNSPYASDAVEKWRSRGGTLELGWHPCLTLDRPILSPAQIPSLVDAQGRFWPLGQFLQRLIRGRMIPSEVELELTAQLHRFRDMVGHWPTNINAHHHIHVFGTISRALKSVIVKCPHQPYIRRVVEGWSTLIFVPGARVKRMLLSGLGRCHLLRDFPGADRLVGITDPHCVQDPEFFARWLRQVPGESVELACHPGYDDDTLIGRDGSPEDGLLERRPQELKWLADPSFREMTDRLGFQLVPAAAVPRRSSRQRFALRIMNFR